MLAATQRSCSAVPSPPPLLLPEAGAPEAAEARSDESAVHPLASTLPNPEYWPRSRAAWTSFFFAIVTSCGASGGAGALGSQHQASSWSRGQHQVMGVMRGDSGACGLSASPQGRRCRQLYLHLATVVPRVPHLQLQAGWGRRTAEHMQQDLGHCNSCTA